MPRSFLIRKILGLDDGHNDENDGTTTERIQFKSGGHSKTTEYEKLHQG